MPRARATSPSTLKKAVPEAPWRHITEPVYAKAWKALGLSGDPPPWVDAGPLLAETGKAIGMQPNDERDVYLDNSVVRGLGRLPFGHSLSDRLLDERQTWGWEARDPGLTALNTLLHEYAHVQQPRPLKMPLREAGATAYADKNVARVMAALGLPMPRSNQGVTYPIYWSGIYQNELSDLLHRPGSVNFIDRGQFGR